VRHAFVTFTREMEILVAVPDGVSEEKVVELAEDMAGDPYKLDHHWDPPDWEASVRMLEKDVRIREKDQVFPISDEGNDFVHKVDATWYRDPDAVHMRRCPSCEAFVVYDDHRCPACDALEPIPDDPNQVKLFQPADRHDTM
jgi:hypothetical protein